MERSDGGSRSPAEGRRPSRSLSIPARQSSHEYAPLIADVGALHRREAADGGRLPVFTPATLSQLRAPADRAGD